jgi:hypothetical protein
MSWTIGTITLPKSPKRTTRDKDAITDSFPLIDDQAIAMGLGTDLDLLMWELTLNEGTKSLATLDTDYITPLLEYSGSTVALSTPFSSMNGTWLVKLFKSEMDNQKPEAIYCKILFTKGSDIIIV